jgi:hypothetical protein
MIINPSRLWLHYKNKPNNDSLYKVIGVSVGTKGHVGNLKYFGVHSENLREVAVYKLQVMNSKYIIVKLK